jgi:hypothetical protein
MVRSVNHNLVSSLFLSLTWCIISMSYPGIKLKDAPILSCYTKQLLTCLLTSHWTEPVNQIASH